MAETLGALTHACERNEVMALLERFYDPSSGVVQALLACPGCEAGAVENTVDL